MNIPSVRPALVWSFSLLCLPANGAVGEDAQKSQNNVNRVQAYRSGSIYLSNGREELLEQLGQAVDECIAAGFESPEAAVRLHGAYVQARRFLENYPDYLRRPEVGILPDGEITFEWYRDPQRTLFASLNARGFLSYAGIFGEDEVKSAVQYTEDIPVALWTQLDRLEKAV